MHSIKNEKISTDTNDLLTSACRKLQLTLASIF